MKKITERELTIKVEIFGKIKLSEDAVKEYRAAKEEIKTKMQEMTDKYEYLSLELEEI